MGKRNYERLPIEQFGRQLITSGDVDPIYIMLTESKLSQEQIKRWCVAYWCYYNAGLASYLSEFKGSDFWDKMMEAAENVTETPIGGRWPRGKERRHFRGYTSVEAVKQLSLKYPHPEMFVDYLTPGHFESFLNVSKRVKEHYAFGTWISFKVCDMLERVLGAQVGFDEGAIFMFADPEKAAMMLFEQQNPGIFSNPKVKPKREKILKAVTEYLQEQFKDLPAPPRFDRQINIQEVETVLCKWKSHMNGHYPLNNDIHEIAEGLEPWLTSCPTAVVMLQALPKAV